MPNHMTIKQAQKHGFKPILTLSTGAIIWIQRYGKFSSAYTPQREIFRVASSGGLGGDSKRVSDWAMPEIRSMAHRLGDEDKLPSTYRLCWSSGDGDAAEIAEFTEMLHALSDYVEQLNAENIAEWEAEASSWAARRDEWNRAEQRQRDQDFALEITEQIGRPLRKGDRIAIEYGQAGTKYGRFECYKAASSRRLIAQGGSIKQLYKAESWVADGENADGFIIRNHGGGAQRVKKAADFVPF